MGLTRRTIFLNLFWSVIGFLASITRTIFLVPLFLSNWSAEQYAFWLLIFNFYAISIYSIEGYSRYSINHYSKLFFSDPAEAYRYFGSALRIIVLLGTVAILISVPVFLTGSFSQMFAGDAPGLFKDYHLQYALLAMFILSVVHSITKFVAYAVIPHGKVYLPERFTALYTIVEASIWALAAAGFASLLSVFLFYSISLSLFSLGFLRLLYTRYPFYKVIYQTGRLRHGWNNLWRSLIMVANNFGEKFTVEGLNFIVASLYSAVLVPVYATTRTVSNTVVTGTNMIVATFTIEYQRLNVKRDGQSLFNLFSATWMLVGLIVNFGIVIFYPIVPDIFELWTNGKILFDRSFFDVILMAGVFIVYGSNIIIYLKAVNRIRPTIIISFVRAATMVSLLVLFPKGLIYLGISLALTEFVINAILLNFFLHRELAAFHCAGLYKKMFWVALPFMLTAIFLLVNARIPLDAYLKMGIMIALLTVAYLLQIRRIDNEALVLRLQVLKYKVFNLGKDNHSK